MSLKSENSRRSKYSSEWEVDVPTQTKLNELHERPERELDVLPERDLEDERFGSIRHERRLIPPSTGE